MSLPPSLRVAVSLFLCLGTVPIVSAQNIDAVRMPLTFERNQGQLDKQVHYLVRSGNGTIFLTDHEMVMSSRGAKGIHVVRMVMRGAASIAPKAIASLMQKSPVTSGQRFRKAAKPTCPPSNPNSVTLCTRFSS